MNEDHDDADGRGPDMRSLTYTGGVHQPRQMMIVLTALIVVGIGAFVASVASGVQTSRRLADSSSSSSLSSARNSVELLEHRARQEESHACLARYIHDVVVVSRQGGDTDSVELCHEENLDGLRSQLADARARLAEISPHDPALTAH